MGAFIAQTSSAAKAVKGVGDAADGAQKRAGVALGGLTKSIRDNRGAWDDLSSKAMIGGAAIAGGLGLAAKAAIDWESAWAGVNKTVDGTPEQMAQLEQGLRGLAKTLPATHAEIAGVAEAAGQLGVARGDILKFTETAIALGESTNLSADEAATSLAKFSNIMGTTAREGVAGYEKLGSTLVALGNDGASTEADIMSMALRLAGAGKQIGATEADILAMSNALTSVGIEAELGGGAMSRAMLSMNSAVISGGDELKAFAGIAGMSASDFATAWRNDPIEATNSFVAGLGKIGASGGDASAALESVGLSGTQNAQVLLRAAGASDLLSESLDLGASAWAANSALSEEAGKRYATDASKIKVAVNQVKDAMITVGADVAPMVAAVAGGIGSIADKFGELPGPVRGFITALTGVTGGTLLLGGAAIKTIGFAQDLSDALGAVAPAGTKAAGGLDRANRSARGIGTWGKYALGAAVVITTLNAIDDAASSTPSSIEDVTSALLEMRKAGDSIKGMEGIDQIFKDVNGSSTGVDGLAEAFKRLNDPSLYTRTGDWMQMPSKLIGMSTTLDEVAAGFEQTGQALANMPADEAAAKFDLMVEAIGGGEANAKKLLELMPAYRDSLTGAANDAKLAGDGASKMGGDVDELGDSADQAQDAIDGLSDAISGLGDTFLGQREAARGYEAALDAMRDSINENGKAWGNATPEGRANMEALEGIATAARDSAAAIIENKGSVAQAESALAKGRGQIDLFARAMNLSKSETRQLKDEILRLPADAEVEFKESGADATKAKADGVKGAVIGIPEWKQAQISESGADAAKGRVLGLSDSITLLNGKTVLVGEDGAQNARGKVLNLDASILGLKGKTVQVQEIGSTASGGRVVSFKGKIYEVPESRTTSLNAQVGGLWDVATLRDTINSIPLIKNVVIRATTVGAAIGIAGGRWAGGIDGIDPMAAGGVRPGGSVRPGIYPTSRQGILMAEDTNSDWEAYIPERMDLRPRAEMILADVARRFGKAVVPLAGITEMASGGVYSRWQKELRDVRSLANNRQYRWEDGSRMISVFEDGTARWGGYGSAPSGVAREIAQLNAAQDAYENALNAPKAAPKAKKAWQHDPQWYVDQRRFAANKAKAAKPKPKWQHSQEYWDTINGWAASRKRMAAGGAGSGALNKSWAGSAFKRSPSAHEGRTYVAPAPRITSGGGTYGGSSQGVSITEAGMERAITSAFSRVKVTTTINGRDFAGVITKTTADRKGR